MPGKVDTKLFVGQLGRNITENDLRPIFEQYGTVTECDVLQSGYGFVHMSTSEEANAAVENLNGYEVKGQNIKVEASTSRVRQKPGMGAKEACFKCGKPGHWSKECRGGMRGGRGGGYGPPRGGMGRGGPMRPMMPRGRPSPYDMPMSRGGYDRYNDYAEDDYGDYGRGGGGGGGGYAPDLYERRRPLPPRPMGGGGGGGYMSAGGGGGMGGGGYDRGGYSEDYDYLPPPRRGPPMGGGGGGGYRRPMM